MACMKKIKRAYELDEDVSDAFDEWAARTRTKKNDAIQLGMWLVICLSPQQRQEAIDAMDARGEVSPEIIQLICDRAARPAEVSAEEAERIVLNEVEKASPATRRRHKA